MGETEVARAPLALAAGPLGVAAIPPVARGNLTDRVQHLLRERILSGEWPAGTKLPRIERLAADAGVSRTVAREAVKALATQGLLEVVHGLGTLVAPRTNRPVVEALRHGMRAGVDPIGIVEVRLALEVEAAALAAVRRTDEDLAALREAASRTRALRREQAGSEYIAADVAFHEAVVRATHNPVFVMVAESIAALLEETRRAVAQGAPAGGDLSDQSREEAHAEILERIEAGDRDEAAAAMRGHLSRVRDNLSAVLRQRGGTAP